MNFFAREFSEPRHTLAGLLPWGMLIDTGTVLNKNGSFLRVARFRGADLESSTASELIAASTKFNNAARRLGSGWCLHFDIRRRPADPYPTSPFPDPATRLIDRQRRHEFDTASRHLETEYYLAFTYLPPPEVVTRITALLFRTAEPAGKTAKYQREYDYFGETVDHIVALLAGFMTEVTLLDDDGLLTYLAGSVSTSRRRITAPKAYCFLDAMLTDMPLLGGTQPRLGTAWLQVIGIRDYISATTPGVFHGINSLPFPCRWVGRYLPLDKQDALVELRRHRRHWYARRYSVIDLLKKAILHIDSDFADSAALAAALDSDAAIQELETDLLSFGYFTPVFIVADDDPDQARDKARCITEMLDSAGFVSQVEDINALEAWLGAVPGNPYANCRKPLVGTLNLAHMVPLSAVWAGPRRNRHLDGPALAVTTTASTTLFRLDLHHGDVGHTLIIGRTGGGKSVLLGFLAAQFRRYPDARIVLFERGRSARALTLAAGGEYFELGQGTTLGFQPFARADQEAERIWLQEWLAEIFRSEHVTLTPDKKEALWRALGHLGTLPRQERTFSIFQAHLQDLDLKQAITPYTLDGPAGSIFDNNVERLSRSPWQGFDLDHLMASKQALTPTLLYLFHVLEQQFTGEPTLLILDEAWTFLDHSGFAARIREWLKMLRKLNVSVVFATQSIADVMDSSIAPVLLESCITRIFLPNERIHDPNIRPYYAQFGLNDRQIDILAAATPRRDYYYTSPAGNRLFSLPLTGPALALCGSGAPEDHVLIDGLLDEGGTTGFAARFLARKGFAEAARHAADGTDPAP